MHQKLIYYCLYPEEKISPMDACPQLFQYVFYYIVTRTIYSHMKLSIMGQTCHGQIGCKYNVVRCNFLDKTDFQVLNINTNLIEYVPKKLVNK